MKYTRLYRNLVAKTDCDHPKRYPPLWMHTRDAVGTMCYLIDHWLAERIIRMTGLSRKAFRKLAIFCIALHDVGTCAGICRW